MRRLLSAEEELKKGNVKMKCEDHAPKSNPRWLKKKPEWFVGRYVKIAFPAVNPASGHKTFEHMWVQVLETREDGRLAGRLANAPVFRVRVNIGDWVDFGLDRIEDVLPKKGQVIGGEK
jgi:hypothetical protein